MRTVFVLFDSLNRHLLSPYGGHLIQTPNFERLAKRSTRFDRHYAGSLPCMPARRDLLTGRLNFLHRSWGPMEPFDNAVPSLLAAKNVYSHLITDHCHYWEDGGSSYHTRYTSHEFIRGQEGDPWKALVRPDWLKIAPKYHETQRAHPQGLSNYQRQYMINRELVNDQTDFPSAQVFASGIEFLEQNSNAEDWFLQLETFDPHEPFFAPSRFRNAFPTDYKGPILDWPRYGRVEELPEECDELRANYYATVAHCDELLGKLLDKFDEDNLWENTALIVSTDHGFLLGEHDYWAKNRMCLYQEIVHLPLFIAVPGQAPGVADELSQTSDIAGTILDLHKLERPPEMRCHSLLPLVKGGKSKRKAAIFGYFGGAINVTDGCFSYHRYPTEPESADIYQYTLMPAHIRGFFLPEELADAKLVEPLPFTKGMPVLKARASNRSIVPGLSPIHLLEDETRLYDLAKDPGQQSPIQDSELEKKMIDNMRHEMAMADAPSEAYERLSLTPA